MGSIGFLVGPPFIGFLADATSLAAALFSLVVANVIVARARVGGPRRAHRAPAVAAVLRGRRYGVAVASPTEWPSG